MNDKMQHLTSWIDENGVEKHAGPAGADSLERTGSALVACAATPRDMLLRRLLDPRVPKNEVEWCCGRELQEAINLLSEVVRCVPIIVPEWRETYLYGRCEKLVRSMPNTQAQERA